MTITFVAALIIALSIPIGVVFFIYKLNFFKTSSIKNTILVLFYGAGMYVIAALINSKILLQNDIVNGMQLVRFITPWEEEILKAILFLFLLRQVENMSQFIDWVIYGFAIGIGFAVIENMEYIFAYQHAAFSVAISRVISTNLIHASATALSGTAFGFSRFHPGIKKILVILGGLMLGILIHFGFNNLVNVVSSSLLLVYAAVAGIGSAIFIFFIIKWGLKQTRNSLKETLTMADRVTKSESRLVQEYDKSDKLIGPLEDMFGKTDAKKIHEFLELQIRMGMHRNNQDHFSDKKLAATSQSTADTQRERMNEIRKELGPYIMLMVRNIFPESDNQLWGSIESTLEQRMKSSSHKRGGLFDSLEGKLK